MRINKKYGLIITTLVLVVCAVSIVNANSILKTIEVHYGAVQKIIIDGIDKTPKQIKPFIYEGTTYVPLRYVGESLGKPVDWDGNTGTIYIGSKIEEQDYIWIEDLESLNSQCSFLSEYSKWDTYEDKDNTGKEYKHGLRFDVYHYLSDGWIYNEYFLNKEYKQITGKFVLTQKTKNSDNNAILEIYGDDKLLYSSPKMAGGILPIDLNVNIEGVKILKIKILHEENFDGDQGSYSYGLVDTKLIKNK